MRKAHRNDDCRLIQLSPQFGFAQTEQLSDQNTTREALRFVKSDVVKLSRRGIVTVDRQKLKSQPRSASTNPMKNMECPTFRIKSPRLATNSTENKLQCVLEELNADHEDHHRLLSTFK